MESLLPHSTGQDGYEHAWNARQYEYADQASIKPVSDTKGERRAKNNSFSHLDVGGGWISYRRYALVRAWSGIQRPRAAYLDGTNYGAERSKIATPAEARNLANPRQQQTADMLAEADEHFVEHCGICHGIDGRG